MPRPSRSIVVLAIFAIFGGCAKQPAPTITPEQAIASKTDLWGEAALKSPRGPTYEYFERLLPPLRYVDADFVHYPIVLSAPSAKVKARLLSNGSQVNALARQPTWQNESGTPIHIRVGIRREEFGGCLAHVMGPKYAEGYLPIVQLQYATEAENEPYGEEAFAAVDADLAAAGAALVKFDLPGVNRGRVELRFETGHEYLAGRGHAVRDASGKILAVYDDNWEFNKARSTLMTKEKHAASAVVMFFTAPVDRPGEQKLDLAAYEKHRDLCKSRWNEILVGGINIDVPEPIVNNAWRTLVIGTHEIAAGDQLNYSASNQYARQYSNESGDTMRSLLLFGHREIAKRGIKPLFVYRRPNIELHDGAFKLELLADYFFQTHDTALIEELRPLWQREVDLILCKRQPDGLLPKEKYCSDIDTPVRSLNTNANCWRGLRDMAVVLAECGHADEAEKLAKTAAEYRPIILAAMDKAIVHTVDPPWVPVALDGEEPPAIPITSTRMGSYWNLVVPCVLWSGLFPIDSPPATAIMDYIRTQGGLCMGMTRVQSPRGVWMNVQNIDDLYTLRYQLALLRRDHPGDADRALVGFYGKLAQGFTRDTFLDGESTSIIPTDVLGRQVAAPPNSTANANFLLTFRNLLVQDWDTDDDGRADSLRIAFATPRAWLEDGKKIHVERAATEFGELSFEIRSMLKRDRIEADISLPTGRTPRDVKLRLRLPSGCKVISAKSAGLKLPTDGETIDLSELRGAVHVIATCGKGRQ